MPEKAVKLNTLHTQYLVASTWLSDHPVRLSMPLIRSRYIAQMRFEFEFSIVCVSF